MIGRLPRHSRRMTAEYLGSNIGRVWWSEVINGFFSTAAAWACSRKHGPGAGSRAEIKDGEKIDCRYRGRVVGVYRRLLNVRTVTE